MTFENALKKIKTKFEELDATKLADMAVQVTMTDEDCGGTFYFKAVNGVLEVEGYDYRDNDAVIDIERKALNDILSGKTTLDKAIEKGVATAKGDFDKLNTLNNAIVKKAPVKKAAAKKAPAKKEAEVKAAPAKKETKTVAKKAATKTAETKTAKAAAEKKAPAKKTAAKTTAKKA